MQKNRMIKVHDLTTGDITKGIWSFAVPLMLGNVMQQLYNLVDTWVVGTYLGNGALTVLMIVIFYSSLHEIISLLQVPEEIVGDMYMYLFWVFFGFFGTFIYNYVSNVLRGIGNSVAPLIFLGVSV